MNIHKPGDYFLLPINICQWVIRNGRINELQLLLAMKMMSSGIVYWDISAKKSLAKKMGVTVRTVENRINKLLELEWIGKSKKRIYLRKLDLISQTIDSYTSTGVRIYPDDIRHFKGFVVGVVIGYLVNMQKLKRRMEGRSGSENKWGDKSTERQSFQPIAISVLCKVFECSTGTAYTYKEKAIKHNYVQRKIDFHIIRGVPTHGLQYYKELFPEHGKCLQIKGGNIVQRLPDLYLPTLKYKARKKLKHIKGGHRGGSQKG